MRLQKLTNLEVDKVVQEYKELIKHIANLKGTERKARNGIKTGLKIRDQYGTSAELKLYL